MPKYQPLADHLRKLDRTADYRLTFSGIEAILGFKLPKSAHGYQAWWANQRNGRHVQANAWLDAGWHTQNLDLRRQKVGFHAVALPRAPTKAPPPPSASVRPLTVAQAKMAVAAYLGVRPHNVEIIVRA